jgi:hypothetical protein
VLAISAVSVFEHAWKWTCIGHNGQWLLESAGEIHGLDGGRRVDICHISMPVRHPTRLLLGWYVLTLCNQCGEIPIDEVSDPISGLGDPQDRCPSLRLEHGICVKCWVGEHPFLDDDGEAEKRKKHSKRVAAYSARMKLKKVRMH